MNWNGSWATVCTVENDLYFIANDKERLQANDTGGSIYYLNVDSFSYDDTLSMGDYEWITSRQQTPVKEERYPSALQAMRDKGVRFVVLTPDDYAAFMAVSYEQRKTILLNTDVNAV
jgi:hypothetical protein